MWDIGVDGDIQDKDDRRSRLVFYSDKKIGVNRSSISRIFLLRYLNKLAISN